MISKDNNEKQHFTNLSNFSFIKLLQFCLHSERERERERERDAERERERQREREREREREWRGEGGGRVISPGACTIKLLSAVINSKSE